MRDIRKIYLDEIESLDSKEESLQKRSRLLLAGKIVFFACAIVFISIAASRGSWIYISLSIFCAILYVAAYTADSRCRVRIRHLEDLKASCRKEIGFLDGNLSCFENGSGFIDQSHEFSFDLDIFGENSLFQRMNRTVTEKGAAILAGMLTEPLKDKASIARRQEAVSELAGMFRWRLDFISGSHVKDGLEKLSDYIGNSRYSRFITSSVVPYLMTVITLACLVAGICGFPATWAGFGIMFMAQLLTASLAGRSTIRTSSDTDSLYKEYSAYLRLLELIHRAEFNSPDLAGLKQRLFSKGADCSAAFTGLSRILNLYDQRGGFVLYFILNGTVLYDIILIRLFIRWGQKYLPHIKTWLESIAGFDALVSLATYSFNNPRNVKAEISSDPDCVISAREICHPFIPPDRAVPNDFEIRKHKISIITGANMAGKSTFLRTIGVNYILACNGVPVFAASFRFSVSGLFSSMRTSDNLSKDISYFNAELSRLKQLIDYIKANDFTLIILDEILKGTNSRDKLKGSVMFLRFISGYNVSGIVATHDLELADMEKETPEIYSSWCFEIGLSDKIDYTYRISRGVARNLNASYLLSRMLEEEA